MFSLISVIAASLLLAFEGKLLFTLLTRSRGERLLGWSMGYGLGALINAVIVFALQLFAIPLKLPAVGALHLMTLAGLWFFSRHIRSAPFPPLAEKQQKPMVPRWLVIGCGVLLGFVLLNAAVSALVLPPFFWDGFAQWAMRAKQALSAATFTFEGVTQPQYPILLHALQILPMLAPGWSDPVANAMTLLLSLSTLLSFFLLMKNNHGAHAALLTTTLLATIPLFAVHLRQGYADIHWGMFALLAACTLNAASRKQDATMLLLSFTLIAAAAWTKVEGLYLGVLPWFAIVSGSATHRGMMRAVLPRFVLPLLFILPWPLYVFAHGLPYSPHGMSIGWHPASLWQEAEQLFAFGTFGLHWWAIAALLFLFVINTRRLLLPALSNTPSLLWGMASALLVLVTYVFTEEIAGLIQGDNFSRAMLTPTLLLTASLMDAVLSTSNVLVHSPPRANPLLRNALPAE